MFNEDDEPPSDGIVGGIVEAAKVALPFLGPAGAVGSLFLGWIAGPVVRRRFDEWGRDLQERVRRLEEMKVLTEDSLKDERFVDAVITASRAAAATSSAEKHAALRNAVLNVALKHAPEADSQQLFLRYVDELFPTHLKLLKIISEPGKLGNTTGGAVENKAISNFFPGDATAPGADRFLEDLIDRGLVSFSQRRQAQAPPEVLRHPKLHFTATPFGEAFLTFIGEPPELR